MSNIPAKNGIDQVFQLAAITLPGGEQAQAIVLVGADGNPVDGATQTTLAEVLARLNAVLAVSGTVAVSNLPGTQQVAGTVSVGNFPATQPVSIAALPSVAVSNFPASQPVSLAVAPLPANAATSTDVQAVRDRLPATPHTQPLTDAQLRAAPLSNPVGAASAEKQDELKAIAAEIRELAAQNKELADTMLYFLAAVLDKMPTLTNTDAANVTINGGISISSGAIDRIGGFAGGNAALLPWQFGAGPSHIYNQISVTP